MYVVLAHSKTSNTMDQHLILCFIPSSTTFIFKVFEIHFLSAFINYRSSYKMMATEQGEKNSTGNKFLEMFKIIFECQMEWRMYELMNKCM
jgi:hypothetical protein